MLVDAEVNVAWWRLRTSNPSKGGNVLGEFDSHTPPPSFYPEPCMESAGEVIICFESVSGAIMAEEALVKQAINVRVMPVPSGIRGGCGFCLRFSPEDAGMAAAFLAGSGFDVGGAWERSGPAGAYRKFTMDMTDGGTDGER